MTLLEIRIIFYVLLGGAIIGGVSYKSAQLWGHHIAHQYDAKLAQKDADISALKDAIAKQNAAVQEQHAQVVTAQAVQAEAQKTAEAWKAAYATKQQWAQKVTASSCGDFLRQAWQAEGGTSKGAK
ncbi:MAG: hypothetical protein JO253_06025 [Alphaproteobacteria bacterium]|nr:hypothetical protein [Alphaproteobacteria bacterium]